MNSHPSNSEPTIAQLVSDIMVDARLLMRQELALAQHELRVEMRKGVKGVIALGAGVGITAVGGLFLIVMIVHLLNALTGLPLWACYGIVGGAGVVVGVVLLYRGKQQLAQIDLVPQQTVATMKENVRWIKGKSVVE